jgi:hypothetical protein
MVDPTTKIIDNYAGVVEGGKKLRWWKGMGEMQRQAIKMHCEGRYSKEVV